MRVYYSIMCAYGIIFNLLLFFQTFLSGYVNLSFLNCKSYVTKKAHPLEVDSNKY